MNRCLSFIYKVYPSVILFNGTSVEIVSSDPAFRALALVLLAFLIVSVTSKFVYFFPNLIFLSQDFGCPSPVECFFFNCKGGSLSYVFHIFHYKIIDLT